MAKFTAYVEFYGKKLKITDVEAISEEQAKKHIQSKIKFIKMDMTQDNSLFDHASDLVDKLGNLFKFKK